MLISDPAATRPRRRLAVAGIALGLAFAAFCAAISRGVFLYGDDVLMYQVARSIAERGTLEVTSPHRRGSVARSVRGLGGGRYAKYGIGLSLVAVPFSELGETRWIESFELPETRDEFGNLSTGAGPFAAGLTNAAAGGALVAVLFWTALELGFVPRIAAAIALLAGFATPLPHYAAGFLSEPLSVFCLTASFLGLARLTGTANLAGAADQEEKDHRRGVVDRRVGIAGPLALAGGAAGLAFMTRALHLLVLAPIAVATWFALGRETHRRTRARSFLLWSFPFLLGIAAVAWANAARFGSIFETGYRGEARRFETPLLEGLAGQLVSPGKGLFWFAPLVVLGLLGFRRFVRRAPAFAWSLAVGSAALLLVTSKYYQWHGGGAWGPRFLVPLIPLWLLPVGEHLARWREAGAVRRAIVVVLVAAGLVSAAIPVLVPFDRHIVDVNIEPTRFDTAVWTFLGSPLVRAAAEAPAALAQTITKLAGLAPLEAVHQAPARLHAPDAAFVRYGSHALLQWTRASLLVCCVALLGAWSLLRPRTPGPPRRRRADA